MSPTEKPECAGYLELREKDHLTGESILRSACHGNAVFLINEKNYCLMHAPTKSKTKDFETAFLKKLAAEDYSFRGVWFPGNVDLSRRSFKDQVDFRFAVFNGKADFNQTQFNGWKTYFSEASFIGGDAVFSEACFSREMADFGGVKFSGKAYFSDAIFGGSAAFSKAKFGGGTAFFCGTKFHGSAFFSETHFTDGANFRRAEFGSAGSANFWHSHFVGAETDFSKVVFGANAGFREAQFDCRVTDFSEVRFRSYADFIQARFSGGKSSFNDSEFVGTANFAGAKFSGGEADFGNTNFRGGNADFRDAQFGGGFVTFNSSQFSADALFNTAQFSGGYASFRYVRFSGASSFFDNAKFDRAAYFHGAIFTGDLSFKYALFEKQVFFEECEFSDNTFANFKSARFRDLTRFIGCRVQNSAELYFGEATFEKPELVLFHSIFNLQPRWFVNVDARKFNFESVEFPILKKRTLYQVLKLETAANKELKAKETFFQNINFIKIGGKQSYKLLITAYRRLAMNAEENNRYEEAMGFRYLAMETQRQSLWWRRWIPVTLHWWYWASSGYGERALRATVMLVLIWLIPFLFYTSPLSRFERKVPEHEFVISLITGLENPAAKPDLTDIKGLELKDAAFYSLNVMAFQKPDPKPANESWLTRLVVILQTILGPVQATLLLLAIRRKFMR